MRDTAAGPRPFCPRERLSDFHEPLVQSANGWSASEIADIVNPQASQSLRARIARINQSTAPDCGLDVGDHKNCTSSYG